ncbi:MAG: hypothetical protein JWO02_3532 [Solirubrobacterales bacterium]|nr:hypothetical protein [Solirubrobacterales bacterium]
MHLDLDDLRKTFGFGVAGNFAGHLEQAGEAADFATVQSVSPVAPKGIFPWYVPGGTTFLGDFPLSHDRIAKPASDGPVNLQIEPEVGVLCAVTYADDGTVARLAPTLLGAFNDCSIRRPGAPKISHKKNWGADSKGMARTCFAVTDLDPDGPTATFRLASFLRRDGETHPYGVDSPLPGYSYYGVQLLDWIVDRLNHQTGSPDTPLEHVGQALDGAGRPASVLVGIGATRYTPFGAQTFLDVGDESIVVVYDTASCSPEELVDAVTAGAEDTLIGASVLRQTVYAGGAA